MQSDREDNALPAALLTAAAEQSYGARRARDLDAHIKDVAAAIEAVRAYTVAAGVAPWTFVPAIEPDDRPEQL